MFSVQSNDGKTRLSGRSKARVIDNRDPLKRGRIRVDHPQLGETTWIPYLRDPGQFSVPGIGNVVYVECDVGVHTHPVASGNLTIGTDADPKIPTEFQRDIPTNRGLFTPGGHLIELDDGRATLTQNPSDTAYTTAGRGIRVTTSANNKIHIIEDPSNAQTYILLQDKNGNYIKLDYSDNTLSINSLNKLNLDAANNIRIRSQGNTALYTKQDLSTVVEGSATEDITGNLIINVTGNVGITSNGNIQIDAANDVVLNAATSIDLGLSAFESVIKGDAFKTYFDTHVHPVISVGSPSGPPAVPMPNTTLSNLVKTK